MCSQSCNGPDKQTIALTYVCSCGEIFASEGERWAWVGSLMQSWALGSCQFCDGPLPSFDRMAVAA